MRVGILGYRLDDSESLELVDTGRSLGHETTIFVLEDVTCRPNRVGRVQVLIGGEPADAFDLVLSRAQIRATHTQLDYERYALLCGVPGLTVIDPADTYLAAESKFLGLQRMASVGLPIAPTRSCCTLEEVRQAFDNWGQIVLKPSFGLGGVDVERVLDLDAERATVEKLLAAYGVLVCQPYYPHPEGDVRVTVVGELTPLVVSRVPGSASWKSNVNMGASARRIVPDPELLERSKQAARVMGVTIAGLDFLPTPSGYRIVEFNNTPSWDFAEESDRRALTQSIYQVAVAIHARARAADS